MPLANLPFSLSAVLQVAPQLLNPFFHEKQVAANIVFKSVSDKKRKQKIYYEASLLQ